MVSPSPPSPTLGKSLPSFFSVHRKDPSREKASRASGVPKEGNVLWHFPLSHYTNSLPLLRTTSTQSWYCKEKFEKSNWNAEDRFTSHLAFDMGWKLFCIPIPRKKKCQPSLGIPWWREEWLLGQDKHQTDGDVRHPKLLHGNWSTVILKFSSEWCASLGEGCCFSVRVTPLLGTVELVDGDWKTMNRTDRICCQ